MPEISVLQQFISLAKRMMDENGCYPFPGILKKTDGSLEVQSFMCQPYEMFRRVTELARRPDFEEEVFGLDCYTKEGQGTELDSCVVIFHVKRGSPTNLGILEYQWDQEEGEVITKPVNWENKFWNEAYAAVKTQFNKITLGI
jgi:hypothetical protein